MSYKICKQSDDCIVLQDTGGVVDSVFGAVLAAIGAGIIYLGWFGYQDTDEKFMPLIVALVGSCLFFPVFKRNRLTIDAIRKEVVKTKSWFGITAEKEIVTNNNLSLLEMSGFTTDEFSAFFDTLKRANHHYSIKFYSHPEWDLVIRDISTLINIALFFEKHFDTDLAIAVKNQRQMFSSEGLLRNHKSTPLPEDGVVKETAFQQRTIGTGRMGKFKLWTASISCIVWSTATVAFLLYTSALENFDLIPTPLQYFLAIAFVSIVSFSMINRSIPTQLKIDHGRLIVKKTFFKTKSYPLSDVIGVTNIAKITYLITRQGTESLAYKISSKYSYAIHSWLIPFLNK